MVTQVAPIETSPKFPTLKDYVKWMDKPGANKTENAEIGWVNAAQLVTGLKAAGADFTRQKVVDAINQEASFDANGMLGPLDWTTQHTDAQPAELPGLREDQGHEVRAGLQREGQAVRLLEEPRLDEQRDRDQAGLTACSRPRPRRERGRK